MKCREERTVMTPKTVWCVVYGNYSPREVDSIWATKDDALARADELRKETGDDNWDIEMWRIQDYGMTYKNEKVLAKDYSHVPKPKPRLWKCTRCGGRIHQSDSSMWEISLDLRLSYSYHPEDIIHSIPRDGFRRDYNIFKRYGRVTYKEIKFSYDLSKEWKEEDYLICRHCQGELVKVLGEFFTRISDEEYEKLKMINQ